MLYFLVYKQWFNNEEHKSLKSHNLKGILKEIEIREDKWFNETPSKTKFFDWSTGSNAGIDLCCWNNTSY